MKLRMNLQWAVVIGLLSLLSAGFGSCEKGPAWKEAKFEAVEANAAPEKVELPDGLWNKIEDLTHKKQTLESKQAGEAAPGGSESSDTLPTDFAPLKVFFEEKNEGILGGKNHEIDFGPGGGEIDLSEIVQPLNGSFYFVTEFMPEVEPTDRKVYFLSRALVRARIGEKVGAGCNTFFEVSSAFAKANLDHGFLLNTSDQRHISALVGTYFFAAVRDRKLYLSSLTIRDSQHKSLLCPARH